MTTLAQRYAPHITVLVGLALLPVVVHSYAQRRTDDCANPFVLVASARASDASETRRHFMQERMGAYQWREGQVIPPDGGPRLSYAIVRSYDPKRVYYRPERNLVGKQEPERIVLDTIDVDGEQVPIRVVEYARQRRTHLQSLAAYLLVYDGEPVTNPYTAQILAAPGLMVAGSRPMTLFFVWGQALTDELPGAQAAAREWLITSWRTYQSACNP